MSKPDTNCLKAGDNAQPSSCETSSRALSKFDRFVIQWMHSWQVLACSLLLVVFGIAYNSPMLYFVSIVELIVTKILYQRILEDGIRERKNDEIISLIGP